MPQLPTLQGSGGGCCATSARALYGAKGGRRGRRCSLGPAGGASSPRQRSRSGARRSYARVELTSRSAPRRKRPADAAKSPAGGMSAVLLLRRRGAALQLRALLSWGRVATGATCLREAAACAAAPPQLRSVHAAAASLGSSAHSTAAPGVLSVQQTRGMCSLACASGTAHASAARAVAAAIRRALSTALNSGALASRFMQGSGFSVLEVRALTRLQRRRACSLPPRQVRMTPDLRRAYIRWDAVPGQLERTERELARRYVVLKHAQRGKAALSHCMRRVLCALLAAAPCRFATRWPSWWD